ncbi:MAG: DUF3127 domain-containing protein [Muribaculaceae bacterium]|nr:DUF3127 domain-containing protein [Muribaculaceae bacterium]
MEIEGRIILDLPLIDGVSKAGNPWKKKEWVLETFGQYPRKVKFSLFGDKADNVRVELGKSYAVSVDLESREFNGRWYTDVNAYAAREIAGPGMGAAPYSAAPAAAPYGAAPAAAPYGAPQAAPFGAAPAAPGAPFGAAPAAPAAPDFGSASDSDDLPF